ncbi:hypothetical protein ACB094_01G035200 [Castanea mollissima]
MFNIHKASRTRRKDNGSVGKFDENSGQSRILDRRLTRQRKIRHASDRELGLRSRSSDGIGSSDPHPPDSTRKSRSPSGTELESEHWSLSAVPQPLPPLPVNFSLTRRSESTGQAGHPGSPEEAIGPSLRRNHTDNVVTSNCPMKLSHDENVGRGNRNLTVRIPVRSGLTNDVLSPAVCPHLRPKSQEFFPPYVTTSSAKSSTNYCKGFSPQDLNFEGYKGNSRQKVFVKSAPTMQPAKTTRSPDQSPLCSPTAQSPHLTPKSPKRSALASHHKLLLEGHMDWPESCNHASAYPLPLPPRATLPSQSSPQSPLSTTHHIAEQPHVSSFKGQWQKGRLIGRGTFGSVYIAMNRETGALCAMKEVDLIPDDPKSAECVKQLEQEIKILSQLKHQNIVQYYGSETVDDHFYIYLEYVHPGSVNKYVQEHFGAMTESVVRNFTRHILSGLAYLHSTKTIHRDIKGANLLVDASGVVKLADFGVAKHLTGESCNLSLKGSPYWMAPEVMQAALNKDANPNLALAVDIWSLGCTIIEMLNGKPPWSDFTGPQAMFKVLNRTPPIPETLSSEGKDFLHCCFRRNPAERPTAMKLLEHPFVRNLYDQNVAVSMQAFSAINLKEKRHTVGDNTRHKDQMSFSPGTQIVNGKRPCSRGSCQHHNAKIYNCTEAFRHPSSTMHQVRTSLPNTQLINGSHSFTLSSNISRMCP